MSPKLLASLLALSAGASFSGCSSVVKFPATAAQPWDASVKKLGTVSADSGRWPLSLNQAPTEYTYYSALKKKAAATYIVPEQEVVLGEVSVEISAEINGTVRSWKATAEAGQAKTAGVTGKSAGDALLELKKLLDAGAITPAEYDGKRKALVEKL
jgi:hypothetical protein